MSAAKAANRRCESALANASRQRGLGIQAEQNLDFHSERSSTRIVFCCGVPQVMHGVFALHSCVYNNRALISDRVNPLIIKNYFYLPPTIFLSLVLRFVECALW